MFHHLSSKMKGKHKQGKGSSSSSHAQLGTPASLFTLIVSFPFIFIYTCSYQFIVMFYLTCLMFLLAGHNGFSTATEAASWVLHGEEEAHVEQGTRVVEEAQVEVEIHVEQAGHVEQEAPEEQDGEEDDSEEEEGVGQGGGQQQQVNYMLVEF
jgi:hypothetical protein